MPKKAKLKPLPDYYKFSPGLSTLGSKNIEDKRNRAIYDIEIAHHNYQKTKNLLFVWEAYQHARKVDLPMPSWVGKYLDKVAERVLSVKKYSPEAVEYMMGFRKRPDGPGTGGGASQIKQHKRYLVREFAIHDVVLHKRVVPKTPIDEICDKYTRPLIQELFGIDIKGGTIKNWYYKKK